MVHSLIRLRNRQASFHKHLLQGFQLMRIPIALPMRAQTMNVCIREKLGLEPLNVDDLGENLSHKWIDAKKSAQYEYLCMLSVHSRVALKSTNSIIAFLS